MTTNSNDPVAREPRVAPTSGATRVDDTAVVGYGVHDDVAAQRKKLVSWGAIWAGLVISIALFLLLEFVFFALRWLDFSQGSPGGETGVITAILFLVSFLVGGMTAGATSAWRDATGGLFHGIALWALGVVAIIFLTLFGGGALFGSVASVVAEATQIQQAVNVPEVELDEAVSTAREGSGWAALGLLLPLIAAAVGGAIGGKMGSREPHAPVERHTV